MIHAVTPALFALAAALAAAPSEEALRVLVFSKTAGYRHESIPDGVRAVRRIAAERGWSVVATEDAAEFTEENLARFDVVVFLMTTGDVLDEKQQSALQSFVGAGKGFVGIHSASDTEYDWTFYGELVGAYFRSHPEIQSATYLVEDRDHPATRHLPEKWARVDEQYSFDRNPRESGVRVLLALDETSYSPGADAMGDHPVAWTHEKAGGRAFYTALGHTRESYSDPLFLEHLAGAIAWTGGKND